MPTTYDDKRLVPSPLVTFNKTYKRLGDTKKVKPIYNITINGKILNFKGSPIADDGDANAIVFQTGGGVFDYPADATSWDNNDGKSMLFVKQQAIRELFSSDYRKLQWVMWNGSQPCWCYPRVISIEFPEGLWYRICDFRITLEAESLFGPTVDASPTEDIFTVDSGNIGGSGEGFDFVSQYSLEDASESYSIEMDTELYGVFKCSHTLNAKGYRSLNSVGTVIAEGWENARTWVNSRTGFNPLYLQSGSFGITGGFNNYNHYRTQNTDIFNGSYSITENWLLASGNFYEEYSCEIKDSITEPYRIVGVQGSVNGLSDFRVGIDHWSAASGLVKYNNASGAWANISGGLYLRAQQCIGIPLNPIPVSKIVTHSFNKGVIGYNWEYNNRPLNFVSGAISETLTVTDSNPSGIVNVIGVHTVLNRALGPVLQNIGTTPETKRMVSYEAVFPAPTYGSGTTIAELMAAKPREQVNQLLSGLTPSNYIPGYLFITQDEETYNPLQPRYSRQYSWTYNRQI